MPEQFLGERKVNCARQVVDKRVGIECKRKEEEGNESNFHFRDKVIRRRIWGKREVPMLYQDSCEWVLDVRDIVGKVASSHLNICAEQQHSPLNYHPTLHVIVCSEE